VATRTIAITIIDDNVDEPIEFFYIELLNPVNATLGNPSRIKVNIIDNDLPAQATATPGGVILLDAYEPNNTLREARAIGVGFPPATPHSGPPVTWIIIASMAKPGHATEFKQETCW